MDSKLIVFTQRVFLKIAFAISFVLLLSFSSFAQHDLALQKSVDLSTASIGDEVRFTIELINEAGTAVAGVEVRDLLPAGLSYVGFNADQGTYSAATGIWNVGNILATDDTIRLEIAANVTQDGVLFNQAEVTAPLSGDIDSTPDNGDIYEDDLATACLSVEILLTCGNTLTLTAPSGYTGYQWFKDGLVIDGETMETLVVDTTGNFTFTTNEITTGCETGLCCPVIVTEDCQFDLALDKMLTSTGPFAPGDTLTFTITVYNQGTIDATDVEVTDYVPTDMTMVPDPNWVAGVYTIPTLAAGMDSSFTIDLIIDPTFMGTTITNNAEITNADNSLGQVDEDGDIATIDGAVDDTSELGTDNDIDDEFDGTPGTADNPADADDYDPAQFMVEQTFDLALTKVLDAAETPGPFAPGDIVTFEIEVYNQGTLDAYDIQLSDYMPADMTLTDADWEDNDGDGIANLVNGLPFLAAGDSLTVDITFTIDAGFMGTSITNEAEISYASDTDGGPNTPDTDSNADGVNDDVQGGDNVTDNSNGDEDDHDLAAIMVGQVFDLALVKTLNAAGTDMPIVPGSTVVFDLEVYNQGSLDAYDIQLSDYIPAGLTLADVNWTATAGVANLQNDIPFLAAYDSTTVQITFTVDADFMGTSITNNAEIEYAAATDGGPNEPDADSVFGDQDGTTPDPNDNDNADTTGGDDYDPETITIGQTFDLALTKMMSSYNDVNGDGMISPGDSVIYDITVYNQGTIDGTNIDVTDYVPAGLNYNIADPLNAAFGWGATPTMTIATLGAGMDSTVQIRLEIDPMFMGMSIINNAEITSADNVLGLADEDSTPGDDMGNPSETGTDNDIADDSNGGVDNPADSDDFDPAEVMVGQVFDLALRKTFFNAGAFPIVPGTNVIFMIEVLNQGTLDAYDVQLSDYIPQGLILADAAWEDNDGDGIANLLNPITQVEAGTIDTAYITFTVDPSFQGTSITNEAEISHAASEPGGLTEEDVDSTPDGVNDDIQGADNTVDNTGGDEDDHDPATFGVTQTFDLALTKTFNSAAPTPIVPGSTVTFDLTVYNQGTLDAYDVQLNDYIPAGLTLTDANWVETAGVANLVNDIPFISAGGDHTVQITFTVDADFMGTSITNNAEIAYAAATDGGPSEPDVDSTFGDEDGTTPDGNNDDTADTLGGDDYDPETIPVNQTFDLALTKMFGSYVDNDMDGMISPGDDVIYNITVYNQGTLDATMVSVTDYIPTDMNYDPTDALNMAFNWGAGPNPNTTITMLAAGADSTVQIQLEIDAAFMGSSIINDAEIIGAMGGVDEDSTPGDNAGTPSETDSDNDISDDSNGGSDNPLDNDDFDPAEVMVGQVFDLALTKVYTSSVDNDMDGAISPGDDVTFTIEVFNQGSLDAYDVQVTDYVPAGLILNDAAWMMSASNAVLVTPIADITVAEMSETVTITFTVDPMFQGDSLTNLAEISYAAATDGGPNEPDIDSQADGVNNDVQGADDTIDNSGGDEDDSDPAGIPINQTFDLALTKTFNNANPSPIVPGSTVTYNITVFNQGTLDAYDIEVNDYIPTGLSLSDPNWIDNGGVAEMLNEIPFVAAGGDETVTITFVVDADFMGTSITNNAEIAFATDEDGGTTNADDADSTPGSEDGTTSDPNNNDTADITGGDDYDPETIMVNQTFDLALTKMYSSYNDVDGDGMISAGDSVIYNITVYNQGTLDATNVDVTDYVPADLNYNMADPINAAYGWDATPTMTITALSAGADSTVQIRMEIDPAFMGSSIINNAEITAATGGTDEDSTPGDNAATPSETGTNDDISDDSNGGTDNPADNDDYDPAEITVGQVFDMALTKVYDSFTDNDGDMVISAGDDVTFEIEVINQGSLDAYDVQVTDYIPAGMTLNDANWLASGTDAILAMPIPDITVTEGSETVFITLTIDPTFMGDSLTNHAEISFATAIDDSGINQPDIDSTPDGTDDDVVGGDNTTDNSGGDEDDHDPAGISVAQDFDLALTKTLNNTNPTPLVPGGLVTFDINVFNQGSLDAYDIEVNDYVPAGFTLSDSDWNMSAGVASMINEIPFLAAGDDVTVTITFMIDPTFMGTSITNNAEIAHAASEDGGPNADDVDSTPGDEDGTTPDANNDDIADTMGGDDYDSEMVLIAQSFDLALTKDFASYNDLDGSGSMTPGDSVIYNITVYNQGTLDATSVEITDYLPADLNYNIADPLNAGYGWDATPTMTIAALGAGMDSTVQIRLEIDPAFMGSSIINDAEITGAMGGTDEDSTPGDNAGTPSETGTDNDITDDSNGGVDNPADSDDFDPAEITLDQTFDLALTKVYTSSVDNDMDGAISPGDDVTFTIEVFNQGSLDAYDVQVTDYVPAGLILNDAAWMMSASNAVLVTPIADITVAEMSETVTITFTVDPMFQGDSLTNLAEISYAAATDGGPNATDVDSQADGVNNDVQGADDTIDNSGGDEDDSDPAGIPINQTFDLALTKTFSSASTTPIEPGSTVTFNITVYNQGTLDAYDIQVNDYIPSGLILNDANWVEATGVATMLNEIPVLAAGADMTVPITFTVDPTFMGGSITNNAEIAFAASEDGGLNAADEDSTPNGGADNGTDPQGPNDDPALTDGSDDFDPETIMVGQVFDLALTKTFSSASPSPIVPGGSVTFDVTVYNQGTLDAYDIQVNDYIPTGLILNDANWVAAAGVATMLNEIPVLAAGADMTVQITFTVDPAFMGGSITNQAEIAYGATEDGGPNAADVDSAPNGGLDNGTDPQGTDGDPSGVDGSDDFDPETITVGQTFDLALTKSYSTYTDNDLDGQISGGDDVTFVIEVFNQGTLDAYDVQLSDYIPTGLILNDANWEDNDANGVANLVAPIDVITVAQGSETVNITFTIDPSFMGTSIVNVAEISHASDTDGGPNTPDVDSQADATNDDVQGADNTIDNSGGDEDDHDPAQINIGQVFDLALTKTFNTATPNPMVPGGTVTFNITVYNQGTLNAYDIQINDYIPTGLTLNDVAWTDNAGIANLNNSLPFLAAGQQAVVPITFTIDEDFQGTSITNSAEIAFAANEDGGPNAADEDSTPNSDATNGGDPMGLDNGNTETDGGDDFDPETISINQSFDLALTKMYSSYVDNDADGMISAGDDVIFEITVYNQGTVDATDVEVIDYVPADMIYTMTAGINPANGWSAGPNPTAPIGNLAAGATASVQIQLTIDPAFMGTSIVNNAEIANADNDLGLADEDSTFGDNAGDPSETATDNDFTDGNDDFDPAEVTIGQVFDLALTKNFLTSSATPIVPGTNVTFEIEVFNQGSLDAYDVQVSDYIPEGLLLADGNWEDNDLDGIANLVTPIPDVTVAEGSEIVTITFTVAPDFMGSTLVNVAEISFATDTDDSGINTPDIDSNADGINDDVQGGDNVTNNTGGDEDDHDPAIVTVQQTFDLALTKTFNSSSTTPIVPGSTVTFNITVYNQGTVDAYDVKVNDYIPGGLSLTDINWVNNAGIAELLNEIPYIAAGDDVVVPITFTVTPGFLGTMITNNAEIAFATDTDGSMINTTDVDSTPNDEDGSTPDTIDGDIADTTGGDDYDPETISITQPDALVCEIDFTAPTCNGEADGTATVTATGGSPAYTYAWSNGQTTATATGLAAGTYEVTVTDLYNRTTTCEVTVTEPTVVWCQITPTDIDCHGDNNGTLVVEAFGGTGNYEYSFESEPWQPGNVQMNLDGGFYIVTIRDQNGCEANCNATINEPAELTCSIVGTNVSGCGVTDGTVTVTVTGGTAPMSYSLNGGTPQATGEFTGLLAGVYIVEITDANGCETTCEVEITGPNVPECAITSPVHIECNGDTNGAFSTVGSLGSGMYEFSMDGTNWSPNGNFKDLPGGLHEVTVRDMNNPTCQSTCSVMLWEPDPLTCDFTKVDITCFGANDGQFSLDGVGGTPFYEYSFQGGAFQPGNNWTNLGPGTYNMIVRDENGCRTNCSVDIIEPALLVSTLDKVDVTCFEGNDGSLTVNTTGGRTPYTYILDDTISQSSNVFAGLSEGTYSVDVIDSSGCENLDMIMEIIHLERIEISTRDTLVCETFPVNLNTLVAHDTPDAGTVTFHTTLADAENGGLAVTDMVNPTDTTTYYVRKTGALGCYDVDSIVVNTELCVFDLALTKVIADAGPFSAGDTVTFDINVYNQGTLDATGIVITDFVPVDMTLVDADWSAAGTYNVGNLAAGAQTTVQVDLSINAGFMGFEIINNAEISEAFNEHGLADEDSEPGNNAGSSPELGSDDDVDDDSTGGTDNPLDEDDFDPAVVEVQQSFDLALAKRLAPGHPTSVAPGSTVMYHIAIHNQGTLDAYEIHITDYLPTGLTLQPIFGWSAGAGNTAETVIQGPLAAGDSTFVLLQATVDAGVSGQVLLNAAEISSASNVPNGSNFADDDSFADNDPSNDGTVINDDISDSADEDDHDTEPITVGVFDLALRKDLAPGQSAQVFNGQEIEYVITVINEGDFTASNIDIVDLIPAGMVLSPNETGWTLNNTTGHAETQIAGPLVAGDSSSVSIKLLLVYAEPGANLMNIAEIEGATDSAGNAVTDLDSNPGSYDNNGVNEDDNDGAEIQPQMIDPMGYIYCDKTGRIVTGGQITVTGPGNVFFGIDTTGTPLDGRNGSYQFFVDAPGNYNISFLHPDGYPLSTTCLPMGGAIDPTDLDGSPSDNDGVLNGFYLLGQSTDASGEFLQDATCSENPYYMEFELDFFDPAIFQNNIPVRCGVITSVVCEDINGNNISDPGETGLAGITVELFDCTDSTVVLATTVTDAIGGYTFDGLVAGNYRLRFDSLAGYNFALPNVGNDDTVDSDVDTNGFSDCIALAFGQCDSTVSACLIPISGGGLADGIIAGFTFKDCDKNGLNDITGAQLEGVPVTLTGVLADGTPFTASTTTDFTGEYFFGSLADGKYVVTFGTPPAPTGLDFTLQNIGSNENIDSDAHPTTGMSDTIMINGNNELFVNAGYMDVQGPVITPTDPILVGVNNGDTLTYDCIAPGIINFANVTVSDNCDANPGISEFEIIRSIGSCATTGYLMLMECGWEATDECGNTTRWVAYFKVTDTEAPVFTNVPGPITIDCSEMPSGDTPIVTDNCDDNVLITYDEQITGTGCPYTLVRTWTATDHCGNQTTASQVVTVTDSIDPVVVNAPADITVDCGNIPVFNSFNYHFGDNCDENLTIVHNDVQIGSGCPYTVERTVTITDDCGNSTSHLRIFTVSDLEAPVITNVPADVNVACGTIPAVVDPTVTDNCGTPTLSINETQSGTGCNLTIVRTWTATDACGNTATASQTITTSDNEAPVFTNVPADVNAACGTVPGISNPTVTDNCGTPSLTMNETTSGTGCTQTITRVWTATDACGNTATASQTISINDNEAPVITGVPADTDVDCNNIPAPANPTATDNCGAVTLSMSENNIGTGCTYNIVRTWTATDACGNTTTAAQLIKVSDNAAPVLTNVPANITVTCGNIPAPATPTATDDCGTATVTMNESQTGTGCNYTLTRVWTATDACGNSTTASQVITVSDNNAPVLTLTHPLLSGITNGGTLSVECDNIPTFDVFSATATDDCDNDVEIDFVDASQHLGECQIDGYLLRMECVWTATDDCGNTTSFTIFVNVVDSTPPVISGVPANVIVDCGQTVPAAGTVTAADNCSENVTLVFGDQMSPGACAGNYTIVRTWTATDECGNTSTASQTITVGDNEAPQIVVNALPSNYSCNDVIPAGTANVNDNCDTGVTYSVAESNVPGSCPNNYQIIRTFTATDACGNTGTATQVLNISDNTAPAFTVPADVTIDLSIGQSVPAANSINATDDCDGIVVATASDVQSGSGCDYSITRTYTATDACGNTNTATQVIMVINGGPSVTTTSLPATCDRADGSATVNATGGAAPYTYLWSNGGTTATINNLSPGNYGVTVTDGSGCATPSSVTVSNSGSSISVSIATQNEICDGANGSLTATPTGGSAPYTYSWSNNATGQTINNLTDGTYTVTVTDSNGCSESISGTVQDTGSSFVLSLSGTIESCTGGDGSVTATVTGGTAMTFAWSNGATTSSINGLTAGTYNVTVSDGNGCSESQTYTVLQETDCPCTNPVLDIVNVTPAGCDNNDGTATILMVGNESDFTYTWIPTFGTPNVDGNSRTDLPSGNYIVIVRHQGDADCELKVEFNVAQDCGTVTCGPIFSTNSITLENNTATTDVCLPIINGTAYDYNVSVDGTPYAPPYEACNNDTLMYYSYAFVTGAGQSGPYRVVTWSGNGGMLENLIVNNFDELANVMSLADPTGSWANDYTLRTLSGNDYDGTYGPLTIEHLPSGDQFELQLNSSTVPAGEAVTVNGFGNHIIIITDPTNGCADTLQVQFNQARPRGINDVFGPEPDKDFIEATLEIVKMDCEQEDLTYCLPDISWVEVNNYRITDNGQPYNSAFGGCNYTANNEYSYFSVPGLNNSGPYTIEWMVNGNLLAGTYNNPTEMVELMNNLDAAGNWTLDANNLTVRSTESTNNYGDLRIVQSATTNTAILEVNTNYIASDISLRLTEGMHTFVFERLSDGAIDSITIGAVCIKSDYIHSRITIGTMDTMCINTDDLLGRMVSIENIIPEVDGAAEFNNIDNTACFSCEGMYIGRTKACVVATDEYGLTDTTFVTIDVTNGAINVAVNDTITTVRNRKVVANPTENDKVIGNITEVMITQQPQNGTVAVNADMTITYTPASEYCDGEEVDVFTYELCTDGADCVTAEIFVKVHCEKILVHTGFSPNNDGINDYLTVIGLDQYPDHELTIFNSWGAEIFTTKDYRNDWNGTWDGNDLPDGTYYYVLNDGKGNVISGYIQINR